MAVICCYMACGWVCSIANQFGIVGESYLTYIQGLPCLKKYVTVSIDLTYNIYFHCVYREIIGQHIFLPKLYLNIFLCCACFTKNISCLYFFQTVYCKYIVSFVNESNSSFASPTAINTTANIAEFLQSFSTMILQRKTFLFKLRKLVVLK